MIRKAEDRSVISKEKRKKEKKKKRKKIRALQWLLKSIHTNHFVLSLTQNRRLLCLAVLQNAVHPMIPGTGKRIISSPSFPQCPGIRHHCKKKMENRKMKREHRNKSKTNTNTYNISEPRMKSPCLKIHREPATLKTNNRPIRRGSVSVFF